MLKRRVFLGGLAACAGAGQPSVWAQAYPAKPIKAMLGLSAGGGADVLSRTLFKTLEQQLHQTVVLENRTGAGTTLAAEAVARAEPDGYTMYVATGSYVTSAVLLQRRAAALQRTGADLFDGLAPVSLMFTAPYCLATSRSSGLLSVADVLKEARRAPGRLAYASSGMGSQPHFAGELFQVLTQTRLLHVPYRGLGPAVMDLLGGQVPLVFSDMNTVFPRHRSGELRILAVTGSARPALASDIPTMAEQGISGMDIAAWQGYLVPAKTPKDRVDVLSAAIRRSLSEPGVRDKILENAGTPAEATPDHFQAFLEVERRLYRKLADDAGVRADF